MQHKTGKNNVCDKGNKSFSLRAKHGIKGESFFESLIVEYSLPNHIVGNKDLGLDYFCEWVHGEDPTGILFAVQIKSFVIGNKKPKLIQRASINNKLDEYRIVNTLLKINSDTLGYWSRLGIPIYLFAIAIDDKNGCLDCYYKRFTPMLSKDNIDISSFDFYSEFYKVNDNNKFLAFSSSQDKFGGFARDLFIDYIRCNYHRGTIAYLNPRDIGLNEFPEKDAVFDQLVKEYRDKISDTYSKIKSLMDNFPGILPLNIKNICCPGTAATISPYATYTPLSKDKKK
jgi:hypothetical protein